MKPGALAIVACLLGVATAAHAQVPAATAVPASADTVHLRFAWREGSVAQIETMRYREREAETADTTSMVTRYRMTVSPHAEGLLVSYDDFQFDNAVTPTGDAVGAALAARISSIVPELVVSDEGEFLRIRDAASVSTALNAALSELVDPDEIEDVRAAISATMSEEALTGLAAQEWNAVVGMWIDADLELGVVYEVEDVAPMPLIQGAVVPMISQFTVATRTPCIGDGPANDCVEIRLVTYPDPDSVRAILIRFMEQVSAVPGMFDGIVFEDLEVETEVVLITEPSTLRPHRMSIAKSVRGVVTAGGESSEISNLDVTTHLYRHDD